MQREQRLEQKIPHKITRLIYMIQKFTPPTYSIHSQHQLTLIQSKAFNDEHARKVTTPHIENRIFQDIPGPIKRFSMPSILHVCY